MRFLPPLLLGLGLALAQQAPAPCNGHAELCGRRYSNLTLVGSHNSAFVGTSPADNQETDVAAQLAQGVRFLQAQTHFDNNTIKLCHTLCALEDAGPLEGYLAGVKAFLDANPREVVTLLITNQDGQTGAAFDAVFRAAGIQGYGFVPGRNLSLDQWPTLGQMIDIGQRLVVFMGAWAFLESGIVQALWADLGPQISRLETQFLIFSMSLTRISCEFAQPARRCGRCGRCVLGTSALCLAYHRLTPGLNTAKHHSSTCDRQRIVMGASCVFDYLPL